jgi:hypothetical protein
MSVPPLNSDIKMFEKKKIFKNEHEHDKRIKNAFEKLKKCN